MTSNVLNAHFLSDYKQLTESFRWGRFGNLNNKSEWRISNQEFEEIIKIGNSRIDFVWYSLNLNLFSKTMFNFCPECYTYCNDYIHWKFGIGYDYILYFLYMGKFKELVDENFKNLSIEYQNQFYSHSLKNIETYSNHFIQLLKYFEHEIPGINSKKIIKKAVHDIFFLEEFSNRDGNLSKLFLIKIMNYVAN
jgi:hypothetical protein